MLDEGSRRKMVPFLSCSMFEPDHSSSVKPGRISSRESLLSMNASTCRLIFINWCLFSRRIYLSRFNSILKETLHLSYLSKNSIILFTTTYLPRLEQEEKWSWGGGGGWGRSHRPSGEDHARSCGPWTLRQRQSPGPGISSRYASILLLSFLRISKCCMYKRPILHQF